MWNIHMVRQATAHDNARADPTHESDDHLIEKGRRGQIYAVAAEVIGDMKYDFILAGIDRIAGQ